MAKSGWTLDDLREHARDAVAHGRAFRRAGVRELAGLMRYVDGDYREPETFGGLHAALGGAKRPLHYLAIPPSMFPAVVEGLGASGAAGGARVVVEKPFGRDLASAKALNRTLHTVFPEERDLPDRSLPRQGAGAEPPLFPIRQFVPGADLEPHHVHSVQITMAESFGIAGRGAFYEEVGAIRDVIQNHLLQVVAILAMESPDQRRRRLRARREGQGLQRHPAADPDDLVRGQYRGYRDEPGVARGFQGRDLRRAAARLSIPGAGQACRSWCAPANACR